MTLGRGAKSAARSAVLRLLSPLAPLARWRQGRRLVVLAYHDPKPAAFEEHLAALEARYSLVPLGSALAALASGDASTLPPRPLAITIDDGRRGNADLLSSIRARDVQPTIFACTQVSGRYWWSGLDPLEQRRLKHVPDAERRAATGRKDADQVRESLTPAQIAALAAHFDFEPHTRTHPVLPMCDDATATDEIAGSKADLEAILERSCEVFAYPNGDFGDRDVALVEAAGFRFAFTTRPGLNDASTDRMRLRRMVVRDDAEAWEVLVRASGLPGALQRLAPRRLWTALQVR